MNILISGASKGLGEALARAFLRRGHTVFGFSRNQNTIDSTLAKLAEEGFSEKVRLVAGDISDPAKTKDLVAQARAYFGSIDMVINNVGIFLLDSELSPVPHEDCTLAVTKQMFEAKYHSLPDFEKKQAYFNLMQTNLYGNARFLELVIADARAHDHQLIIADVGSIGAVDQLSKKQFDGTRYYNQSKATLIAHTIEQTRSEKGLVLRAIHPGPFGESAQKIANAFGDTWAIKDITAVAEHAVTLFCETTNETITHGIIASEKHFCWNEEFFGDIEALGIEGLTWNRSKKVSENESTHLIKE